METFGSIIPALSASAFFGFVYLIEVAGRKYIGKKAFNKGSNWRIYKSSNDEIKKLLKERNQGSFSVLAYAQTNRELTWLETKYQVLHNALEDDSFCNANILGKFYRGKLK